MTGFSGDAGKGSEELKALFTELANPAVDLEALLSFLTIGVEQLVGLEEVIVRSLPQLSKQSSMSFSTF